MEMKQIIIESIVLSTFLIGTLFLGIHLGQEFPSATILPSKDIEYTQDCLNLSIEETSNCFRDDLMEFFKFNITNIGKEMSYDELVEQGGVCQHYSEWYNKRAQDIGFNSKMVRIERGSGFLPHQFTVIASPEGYCILEQSAYPACFFFNKNQEVEQKNIL